MKVAIFSRGSSGAYQLAEAAQALGHETLLGEFKTEAERSELFTADILIPRISHVTYNQAVRVAADFASNRPDGITAATATGIERSFDKFHAYQDMDAAGIPTPRTWLVQEGEAELVPRLPLILKPRTENQGRNIAVVTTPQALASHARTLVNIYGSCIAQEFIAESAGRDIRAFVVGNKVVAAMERQAPEGTQLANLSRGGSARSITLDPRQAEVAVRAAQLFGATYAGVDLLQSKNGPVVIEVNVSPGLKIATITDKDIPSMIINHLVALKEQHND